jgi:predicted PurR-regulated permease PerM
VLVVVAVVLGILAIDIFQAAHRPLSWFAAAAVVAVVLEPIIDRLERRIHRFPAVLLSFVIAAVSVVAVAYLTFDDLDRAIERVESAAPEAAARIEEREDRIGRLARDLGLSDRVDDLVDDLNERVGSGDDVIRSTALLAPTYLIGAILTVFLLSYGPRLGTAAIEQLPEARREPTARVLTRSATRARTALLFTVADAAVVGLVAGLAAYLLDLPAPAALGVLAGIFAMLPHLGIVLGSVPIVLLSLAFQSLVVAVIVAVVAIALQVLDSLFVRRQVDHHVQAGLLTPWVVVLLAYDVYGVGAAVYGLAYAFMALAILDELSVDDVPSDGDAENAPSPSVA